MIGKTNIIVIILFVIFVIASQVDVRSGISDQATDSEILNIAGKQRALSQRISKIALLTKNIEDSTSYYKNISRLNDVLDTFISSHLFLENKDLKNKEIIALFEQNQPFYNNIVRASKNVIENKSNNDARRNFINIIDKNEEKYLKNISALASQYQKASEKRLLFLNRRHRIYSVIKFFGVIGVILLLYLPLYKQNKGLLRLNDELKNIQNEIEQKDQEKKKIETILQQVSSFARIGTWEVNLKTNRLYLSPVTKEIKGVPPDYELPSMETGMSFYKEGYSRNRIQEVVSNSIENNVGYDEELELVTPAGKSVWVRAIGIPEFINGECIRLYGTFQDIHKEKMATLHLERINEDLEAIFNTGPISIIRINTEGIITYFNKGAELLLGYTSEEVIGKISPEKFHKKEEILSRQEEILKKYNKKVSAFDVFLTPGETGNFEPRQWTYVRKDGHEFPVQLIVTPIKDKEDKIIGYLGAATDISEAVEREKKLIETNNRLKFVAEELNKQNSQLANFAHISSHNLRAPVSNLDSLLSLYDDSDEKERAVIFDKFRTVINHLSTTLNTLIEAIKIKDAKIEELEIKPITFKKVLDNVINQLSADINKKNATIKEDFSELKTINYNETYLESIMINLISNSLRYSSEKREPNIIIKSKITGNKKQLIISDNGLGIDLKKHGHKLYGLNKVFHRHKDSKGVGLYIIKKQIESLKGSIECQSEVDKGTTFIITF